MTSSTSDEVHLSTLVTLISTTPVFMVRPYCQGLITRVSSESVMFWKYYINTDNTTDF